MSTLRKTLLHCCILVAITALCIEAGSLVFIAATQGRFHYATPPHQIAGSQQWTIQDTKLHPYFGYYSWLADFPPVPGTANATANDQEALIGIFGGSVAQGLYVTQTQTNVLRDALQALPRYAGRRVRIVNFAHSGYKQPQQLNVLNYYLANGMKLDAIILVDGVNEIGFNTVNFLHGMDSSMPMSPVFSDLVRQCTTSEAVDATACRQVEVKNQAARWQAAAEQSTLASGHLLYAMLAKRARAHYWVLSKQPRPQDNATGLVSYVPGNTAMDDDDALERSVQTWRFCSLAMLQAARLAGVEVFEFIQPNQYFKTDRVLTEEERATALDEKSIMVRSIPRGYAMFFEEIDALRAAGLRIFDMTRVFDEVKETIYTDTCCHTNLQGYALMESFIATVMTKELAEPATPAAN